MKQKLLELLPFVGERKARRRWAELERKAGTLPILFALFFTEWAKIRVMQLPLPMPAPEKSLLAALLCAVLYIYDDEAKQMKDKAKEKGEEMKDKAKDKMEGEE